MLRMVGDPYPSKGGVDFFQKSLGDPSPSHGGIDFFGSLSTGVGEEILYL